jgi:hypothetical protein
VKNILEFELAQHICVLYLLEGKPPQSAHLSNLTFFQFYGNFMLFLYGTKQFLDEVECIFDLLYLFLIGMPGLGFPTEIIHFLGQNDSRNWYIFFTN